MKGIIFNLAEEIVAAQYGEDAWDEILRRAEVDGAYTSLGSYPDEELMRVVGAAAELLSVPADTVVRQLGEAAIPLLAERYPIFFEGHDSTRSFLLTLNDIIHPEVKKLYPGAAVPSFGFGSGDDDGAGLDIVYHSDRKLCSLAEGFILGAGRHYGETVSVDQPECMLRGADHCVIRCSFAPAG